MAGRSRLFYPRIQNCMDDTDRAAGSLWSGRYYVPDDARDAYDRLEQLLDESWFLARQLTQDIEARLVVADQAPLFSIEEVLSVATQWAWATYGPQASVHDVEYGVRTELTSLDTVWLHLVVPAHDRNESWSDLIIVLTRDDGSLVVTEGMCGPSDCLFCDAHPG